MNTQCSIVMMSWTRPENINTILKAYNDYNCVGEIIVWNNNKMFFVSDLGLSKVKTINCSSDFGLNTRLIGAVAAANRCVIVHDDDLFLSEQNILGLIQCFEHNHTRIYSYEGRIYQNGKYDRDGIGRIERVDQPTEVDMVLTRSTCFDRLYAIEYCKLSDIMFYDVDLNLNGEDIVLSHIVSNACGKKPLVIPVPDQNGYTELPIDETDKISIRDNFIDRRNQLIDRCSIVLPPPQYPKETNNKLTLFGPDYYDVGYYMHSFSVNSKYKQALIKNDLNGTKYISHMLNPSKIWSALCIDTEYEISTNDCLVINSLFKNPAVPVDVELIFNQNDVAKSTKRTRIRSVENFVSCTTIYLSDLIDFSSDKKNVLKSIKFIIHHQSKESEFCITELTIT